MTKRQLLWLRVLDEAHSTMLRERGARESGWAILVAKDRTALRYQYAAGRYRRARWALTGSGLISACSWGPQGWYDATKQYQRTEFKRLTELRAKARRALVDLGEFVSDDYLMENV